MLDSTDLVRGQLAQIIKNKRAQGHEVQGLAEELRALPDSFDALVAFAERVADLPLRDDWPFVEPNSLEEIRAESDPDRETGALCAVDLDDAAGRVQAAFLGSIAGCILGKPVEMNPTLDELEVALRQTDEWPLRDYISVAALENLPRNHGSWHETIRERISYVAPDDDINYTILGMLILEKNGVSFSRGDVRDSWLHHLPIGTTFGPERTILVKAGLHTVLQQTGDFTGEEPTDQSESALLERWVSVLNPRDELCGAAIRADAYGYACPGRPELASELAWRDAGFTHRRTGIYGTMFVSAAIATAMVTDDRLEIFRTALKYVPQNSRFARITSHCLEIVASAKDWMDAYRQINTKYGEFDHCTIYQEVGTLINTVVFAEDVGDGICKQVSQGNDTDSYGGTAGSLLGAYFGPGHLDDRWLKPFNDDIHTALAWFYERSLTRLSERMAELPRTIAAELS